MKKGNVLQKQRRALGISVYKLSIDTGVDRRTIDRYETNEPPTLETEALTVLLKYLFKDVNERNLARSQLKAEIHSAKDEKKKNRAIRMQVTRMKKQYSVDIYFEHPPLTSSDKDIDTGMVYREPIASIFLFEGKSKRTRKSLCALHADTGFEFADSKAVLVKGKKAVQFLIAYCQSRKVTPEAFVNFMRKAVLDDPRFDPDLYQKDEKVLVSVSDLEKIRLRMIYAGSHMLGKSLVNATEEKLGRNLMRAEKFLFRLIHQREDIVQLKAAMLHALDDLSRHLSSI